MRITSRMTQASYNSTRNTETIITKNSLSLWTTTLSQDVLAPISISSKTTRTVFITLMSAIWTRTPAQISNLLSSTLTLPSLLSTDLLLSLMAISILSEAQMSRILHWNSTQTSCLTGLPTPLSKKLQWTFQDLPLLFVTWTDVFTLPAVWLIILHSLAAANVTKLLQIDGAISLISITTSLPHAWPPSMIVIFSNLEATIRICTSSLMWRNTILTEISGWSVDWELSCLRPFALNTSRSCPQALVCKSTPRRSMYLVDIWKIIPAQIRPLCSELKRKKKTALLKTTLLQRLASSLWLILKLSGIITPSSLISKCLLSKTFKLLNKKMCAWIIEEDSFASILMIGPLWHKEELNWFLKKKEFYILNRLIDMII